MARPASPYLVQPVRRPEPSGRRHSCPGSASPVLGPAGLGADLRRRRSPSPGTRAGRTVLLVLAGDGVRVGDDAAGRVGTRPRDADLLAALQVGGLASTFNVTVRLSTIVGWSSDQNVAGDGLGLGEGRGARRCHSPRPWEPGQEGRESLPAPARGQAAASRPTSMTSLFTAPPLARRRRPAIPDADRHGEDRQRRTATTSTNGHHNRPETGSVPRAEGRRPSGGSLSAAAADRPRPRGPVFACRRAGRATVAVTGSRRRLSCRLPRPEADRAAGRRSPGRRRPAWVPRISPRRRRCGADAVRRHSRRAGAGALRITGRRQGRDGGQIVRVRLTLDERRLVAGLDVQVRQVDARSPPA